MHAFRPERSRPRRSSTCACSALRAWNVTRSTSICGDLRADRRAQGILDDPRSPRRHHRGAERDPGELRRRATHGDRTSIEDITIEDLIVEEDMVVTFPLRLHQAKSVTLYEPAPWRQGQERDGDEGRRFRRASSSPPPTFLLFFTSTGRVHWLKVHELPQPGRAAKGKAIVNVLQLQTGEQVQTMLPVRDFRGAVGEFIILARAKGRSRRRSSLLSRIRARPASLQSI